MSPALGVVATSRKPHERRLPIHPRHVARIDPALRERLWLERGYGEPFGVRDDDLAPLVGGLADRDELLATSEIVLLPKPQHSDVAQMREGGVLWGWPHCVQDRELTQIAIDRRLTLIAWEAMNEWAFDGGYAGHVFHRNNEVAGYCSVLHALTLLGRAGTFGAGPRVLVIAYGATGRGAVRALEALGVGDITVLTHRDVVLVQPPPPSVVHLAHYARRAPLIDVLVDYDAIVNCIFQDPEDPLIFVRDDQLALFAPGTLFVDVSCDTGMGFEWARPTSFAEPLVEVGDRCRYYAVDHSPSYLWDAATWEISEALLPYLPTVLAGPEAWDADETLRRAIEIRDGRVANPTILAFQGRAEAYPHPLAA